MAGSSRPSSGTERRLAAILFTDIVGSTHVTAASGAAGLELRDRHRDLVRDQVALREAYPEEVDRTEALLREAGQR